MPRASDGVGHHLADRLILRRMDHVPKECADQRRCLIVLGAESTVECSSDANATGNPYKTFRANEGFKHHCDL